MAETFRNQRMTALARNAPGNFEKEPAVELPQQGWKDVAEAAQPPAGLAVREPDPNPVPFKLGQ